MWTCCRASTSWTILSWYDYMSLSILVLCARVQFGQYYMYPLFNMLLNIPCKYFIFNLGRYSRQEESCEQRRGRPRLCAAPRLRCRAFSTSECRSQVKRRMLYWHLPFVSETFYRCLFLFFFYFFPSKGAAASLAKQHGGSSAPAVNAPTESISPFSSTSPATGTSAATSGNATANTVPSDVNSGNGSVISANADGSTLDGHDMPSPGAFECCCCSFNVVLMRSCALLLPVCMNHSPRLPLLIKFLADVGTVFQSYYGGIPAARGTDEIYFMGIIDILQVCGGIFSTSKCLSRGFRSILLLIFCPNSFTIWASVLRPSTKGYSLTSMFFFLIFRVFHSRRSYQLEKLLHNSGKSRVRSGQTNTPSECWSSF